MSHHETSQFGAAYSQSYDALYAEKNYSQECDLLEAAFARCGGIERPVRRVLDIGCGTGGHALLLAERGYEVTGVDRSLLMLEQARSKEGADFVRWRQGDARGFDVETEASFDAAILMFAVLGYQLSNADVLATLQNARRHVCAGGLLCADFWHGPAVLKQGTSERMRELEQDGARIVRFSSGDLLPDQHAVDVHFRLWRFEAERITQQVRETHRVRFFFPLELEFYAQQSGWELKNLSVFGTLDETPSLDNWNVFSVLRAT